MGKSKKSPSELRLDPLSRDWVVIATGRSKRPETFKKEKREKEENASSCPFCNLKGDTASLVFRNREKMASFVPDWTTVVVPNKYPAFIPEGNLEIRKENSLFETIDAVGFHDVVVTRDHRKSIALFSKEEAKELIDVYTLRYKDLKNYPFVKYVALFHNHGKEAGATISHPHSQIITTPLTDRDLKAGISSSEKYFKEKNKCIYCEMNEWEMKRKKRIVFENEDFLTICPFASKAAFEMIISPKKHYSYFEEIEQSLKYSLGEALQVSLSKLYKGLGDPSYNFYLHTAPIGNERYDFYHFHFTILPKTAIWAGFEMGARMEISTIEPEQAAAYLRKW